MSPSGVRGATAAVALATVALGVVPGTASAQSLDPGVVLDVSPIVRALAAFVVVALCGGAVLVRRGSIVDRAVDDTLGGPAVAVVYGVGAYVFVLFLGLYANNVVVQAGLAGTPLGAVAAVVLVGGVSLLGGLGYVVVGTLVTDLRGERRPWQGLLLGGVFSAAGWLVLPAVAAFATWLLVAAVGVGGPTRTWFHGKRAADPGH